jgi:hypothetical protein
MMVLFAFGFFIFTSPLTPLQPILAGKPEDF